MPIEINDIINKKKTILVDLDGQQVEIEFRTNYYTPKYHARMTSGDEKTLDVQLDMMAAAILSWDIVNSGKPVEISKETIESLGLPTINKIYSTMEEAVFPSPNK